MADPTEAAAEAASQFNSATEKGGTIRPEHIAELVRAMQGNVKELSNSEHETFFETLASYLETIQPPVKQDPVSAGTPALALGKDVGRRMNMAAETEIPEDKATMLLTRSLLTVIMVDQLIWGVWKNIAPNSSIKRETKGSPSLPTVLRQYLTDQEEFTDEEVFQAFEKTRQLAAGLIGALGPIGRNYGTKAANKYHPESIKEIVGKEGGKGEARYWQKFEELFQDLNEEVIEQDIHRAIVKYTEDLLRGSRI